MSADNFMLVRKKGGKFFVSMEWASNDRHSSIRRAEEFPTLEAAMERAGAEWTEYGIAYHDLDGQSVT